MRYVDLDEAGGRGRRSIFPERIDESVDRNHLTPAQEQREKQGALLRRRDLDRALAVDDLQRSEDPILQTRSPVRPSSGQIVAWLGQGYGVADIDKMHAYRDTIPGHDGRRVVRYAATLYPPGPAFGTATAEAHSGRPLDAKHLNHSS